MSEVLTPIERRIYNYLVEYLKRETYQPSVREIGTRFGIRSTKTVTEHLQSLQRKGYLDRTPSRSRALRILGLDLSPETLTVPLYKQNAYEAGDEEVEARFDLDRSFACSADCFMVRAGGDLRDLGVLEGDLILVEPAEELAADDLAVFDCDGTIEVHRPNELGPNGSPLPAIGSPDRDGNPPPRFLGAVRAVLRTVPRE
jgi:repressor LexA